MIEVRNLTRQYGSFVAVKNVSFSIPQGQIVGLLGHNGAGKTTIMKVLTGYLEPTAGQVEVAGLDIESDRRKVQAKIGYLPERTPVYPEMSVVEYLEYVCRLRLVPELEIPDALRRAVSLTGLSEQVLEPISRLSKGFRQRVGVAQAIIHQPQVLILDEATSGLDPSQIEGMRKLIRDLSSSATVILSTHIMQEVEAVCDRVIIISRGEIAADSLLSDLRSGNALVVGFDQLEPIVTPLLGKLAGVKSVQWLGQAGLVHRYRIELAGGSPEEVLPVVGRLAVERKWKLFQLGREERSLETVFREISVGSVGGSNAE